MSRPAAVSRTGEYAARGDYHRELSPDWEFYPTYLAKLERVRAFLGALPADARVHFALTGRLIRTASPLKHPGDRPLADYVTLARQAGFRVIDVSGIFPTVPLLTRLIRRHPARLLPLHRLLTRLLPVPGWCFLGVLRLGRP